MAEKRTLWPESFAEPPPMRCPTCTSGILRKKKDSLKLHQTAGSRADLDGGTSFEPILFSQRFVMMLVCGNASCQEAVAVCGDTFEDIYQDQYGEMGSTTTYEPKIMYPGPPLADIPAGTPPQVADALRKSFILFWVDLGSAANKLRVAAERILDDQGVKQYNRTGKRTPIAFASRIEIYSQTNLDHKELLTALRWIGNQGSHSGNVDRNDLLTAFELIQAGLQDLYGVNYRSELARRGRDIVARKGRPKRKLPPKKPRVGP